MDMLILFNVPTFPPRHSASAIPHLPHPWKPANCQDCGVAQAAKTI
ncbi:hypothetical protein WG66_000731, partial [Moniliophthora roreri]